MKNSNPWIDSYYLAVSCPADVVIEISEDIWMPKDAGVMKGNKMVTKPPAKTKKGKK